MSAANNLSIDVATAKTLDGLFRERVRLSPDMAAYRYYDRQEKKWLDLSWRDMSALAARWQSALASVGVEEGDRVALILKNSPDWVAVDIATLSLGMADVPLYTDDRPDNIAYILQDSGAKVLVLQDTAQWKSLAPLKSELTGIKRFVILDWNGEDELPYADDRVVAACKWLPKEAGPLQDRDGDPHKLASIVYTSGTTGRSKGVMLSHHNMLSIAAGAYQCLKIYDNHLFLSFLPLSHTFERSCGYYAPMMNGSTVAYARSVQTLADDIQHLKPTVLIAVPRIFERIYDRLNDQLSKSSPIKRSLFNLAVNVGWKRFQIQQGRAWFGPSQLLWPVLNKLVAGKIHERLGGRMQLAVSGGAALPFPIAKLFLGLGVTLIQGYGMTECAPVVCANTTDCNDPQSVGMTLPGVQVRLGENDELEVSSPGRMMGYWNNETATRDVLTNDGWLRTGDKARITKEGFVHITGRIKDILVLSNGEKIPPGDMEQAIMLNPYIEQALVIGEARPYLSALVVINPEKWHELAQAHGIDPQAQNPLDNDALKKSLQKKVSDCLKDFPGYAKIRRVTPVLEPWTVENGLLTPTLKIKRALVINQYQNAIESMYS
ncbi:MAG: long-chain fatty acid--CoA ligase [Gammaproteobacteria bacterium]|nr:long-chain fatty acid--CoA ligase [Gammaproteobacteria bacterium]MDH5653133.1 long-chain fatty acid--CoA ligase [Gammaproteobacteria bacterium]